MTINALTSGSASALAYTSRAANTGSATATQQAGGMRPPPPDDGGGFIGAIAEALESVGAGGSDATSATAAASADSESGSTDAAQALGGFLEDLMAALHAQSTDGAGAAPAYGEPPQGGPGMGGGPGRLSEDLQSLVSALENGTAAGKEAGTEAATGTSDAASSVTALQGSFKELLTSLGSDAGDADARLSSFLRTLSAQLPSAGSSGNLINTTA